MKRLILAVAIASGLVACGGTTTPPADAGTSCSKAAECPELRCLADGGMAAPDAGNGATIRACVFGKCQETCD